MPKIPMMTICQQYTRTNTDIFLVLSLSTKHMKKKGGKMKLRQVMVVEPMRSTMTPKKGTERAITKKREIMKLRKATRFHPKAGKKY